MLDRPLQQITLSPSTVNDMPQPVRVLGSGGLSDEVIIS